MTRRQRNGIRLLVLIADCTGAVWLKVSTRSVGPEVMRQRRQIAEACLSMLRSPLTNEMEIALDDPRLPQVIRDLHPIHIELSVTEAIVMLSGSPAEYHLSRSAEDANNWILYAAGSGALHCHTALLRIDRE